MTFTIYQHGKKARAWCVECAAKHSERNCPAIAKERRAQKRRIAETLAYAAWINDPARKRGESA